MWKGKIHTCNETWMNVSGICVTVYESLNESDRGTCVCKLIWNCHMFLYYYMYVILYESNSLTYM